MNVQRIGNRLQVPSDAIAPLVRRALNRIDAVHTILDVPETPILYTNDFQRFGAYMPEQDNAPRHFELSRSGPHIELTLTHEIGHFIDHAMGKFDVYLSSAPVSEFSGIKMALESSRAITEMRAAMQNARGMLPTHRFQILYWLNPEEQWARAYAQFIAFRSGDAQLLQDIQIARQLSGPYVFRNVQWEEKDFTSVAGAMEATFRKLGWMP